MSKGPIVDEAQAREKGWIPPSFDKEPKTKPPETTHFQIICKHYDGRLTQAIKTHQDSEVVAAEARRLVKEEPSVKEAFVVIVYSAFAKNVTVDQVL